MVHHIFATDASSIITDTGPAFLGANPGAAGDSLIVDENAYLIVKPTGSGAGASLTGIWNVAINGTVGTFALDIGLDIEGSLATDVSKVTIGVNGAVFGDRGIVLNEGGSITNKGLISGRFPIQSTSDLNLSINNSGLIEGSQACISHSGAGDLKITNSGTILGGGQSTIVVSGTGDLSITNSGLIECNGPIGTSFGTLTLVNTGVIAINAGNSTFNAGGGAHITNTGTFSGDPHLSAGADVFTNFKKVKGVIKNGTVTGEIDLGAGADHFNGGAKHETVRDGDGTDIINLGGGSDTFIAIKTLFANNTDADVVDGGKGVDTYDASEATSGVAINLDTATHGDDNPISGLTALGADLSTDHITGFENAIGGAGADLLVGSTSANALIGNAQNDILMGLGGADILTGGAGNDTFQFLKLSDSTTKAADLITDFVQGQDKIDVAAIVTSAGAMFDFIGFQQFSHAAGEFRESFSHGNTILSGDLNGDSKADFVVVLKGHFLLELADFAL